MDLKISMFNNDSIIIFQELYKYCVQICSSIVSVLFNSGNIDLFLAEKKYKELKVAELIKLLDELQSIVILYGKIFKNNSNVEPVIISKLICMHILSSIKVLFYRVTKPFFFNTF